MPICHYEKEQKERKRKKKRFIPHLLVNSVRRVKSRKGLDVFYLKFPERFRMPIIEHI